MFDILNSFPYFSLSKVSSKATNYLPDFFFSYKSTAGTLCLFSTLFSPCQWYQEHEMNQKKGPISLVIFLSVNIFACAHEIKQIN